MLCKTFCKHTALTKCLVVVSHTHNIDPDTSGGSDGNGIDKSDYGIYDKIKMYL